MLYIIKTYYLYEQYIKHFLINKITLIYIIKLTIYKKVK